jgi:hypothetical protein
MNSKLLLGLIGIFSIILIAFAGCLDSSSGGGGGSSDSAGTTTTDGGTADASISITLPGQNNNFLAQFLGTVNDIDSILIDVDEGAVKHEDDFALTGSGSSWSGSITGLPAGVVLTFTASARNTVSTEIFAGANTKTLLADVSNDVGIDLAPVDDAASNVLPKVTQISRAAEFARASSGDIIFSFAGDASEDLNYEITPAASGGSFTLAGPSNIAMSGSGTGSLTSVYTAPSAVDSVGNYLHSVKLTNEQNNWVKQQFDTEVVHDSSGIADIWNFRFSPVITSLGGERSGTTIIWDASADDDGSIVSWGWNYTDGSGDSLSFGASCDATCDLNGYVTAATTYGTITIDVTDDVGLSTSIAYQLLADQFPDNVVVTP